MKPSRQRIIEYLLDHQVATTMEISRTLNITSADVRHHLSALKKQGVITAIGKLPSQLRGRPATVFSLTELASRNNLDLLSHYFLSHLPSQSTEEAKEQLRNIAHYFASNSEWSTDNSTRKIYNTIKYLKSLNYSPTWEAHASSPKVIFNHCPFLRIINDHPELCKMDTYLLEALLDQPVQQEEKLSISIGGFRRCAFTLQYILPERSLESRV